MLKKRNIINLGAIIALGLGTIAGTSTKVDAAKHWKVQLTRNSYVYNSKGHRKGKTVLKKGHKYTAYKTAKIKGKKYIKLSKKRYVKKANTKKVSAKKASNSVDDGWSAALKAAEKKMSAQLNKNTKTALVVEDNGSAEKTTVLTPKKATVLTPKQAQKVKDEFLNYVNNYRKEQGLPPFKTASWLNEGAQLRAEETLQIFNKTGDLSHTRPNGSYYSTAFSKTVESEVLGMVGYYKAGEAGKGNRMANSMIYHDADSNWGHRETLRQNLKNPGIGIGIASVVGSNGMGYCILAADTANLD